MALDSTKWQVTVGKVIEYIGPAHGLTGANYVSVLELHRWLQDMADAETISGDDFVAITVPNPSDKKFDTIIQLLNGFVLGTTTTPADEYIYGGTIIQGAGGTEAIWDGISVIANPGVVVNVIQNNAVLANKFWNNIPFGTGVNGINPDSANGLAMQFMVKVKSAGAFIDNGAEIVAGQFDSQEDARIQPVSQGTQFLNYTPRVISDYDYVSEWAVSNTVPGNPGLVAAQTGSDYPILFIAFQGMKNGTSIQWESEFHMELTGGIPNKTGSPSDPTGIAAIMSGISQLSPPAGTPEANEKSKVMALLTNVAQQTGVAINTLAQSPFGQRAINMGGNLALGYVGNRLNAWQSARAHGQTVTITDA